MNEPPPSDQDDFQQELEVLREILRQNLKRLDQNRFLGTQLEFWMESAKFLETEMEIWESVGNLSKRDLAVERMQKVLQILQQLIDQLNTGMEDEKGES